MEKKLFGLAFPLILVILVSTFMPVLVAVNGGKHDDDWYMVTNGVLDTDYYSLYPYDVPAFESLNVGFSKYGELIGAPPSEPSDDVPPASAGWTGLELGGRDPFANPDVPMERWINGWMIDIEYIHTSPVIDPDRHVWAMALFSDGGDWGYDWMQASDPADAPHGGRKTNTRVETDEIKVIYDGPRRFIAQVRNHIYDQEPGLPDWPVLDLIITIDFNKVKHQVKLLKDVKLTIPSKDLDGRMNVEFSEREEWDLGPAPSFYSYAHFYEEMFKTCYGPEWHLAEQILRHWEGYRWGDYGATYYLDTFIAPIPKTPVASGFEKVYVNGELMRKPSDYRIDYESGVIEFADPIEDWERIDVVCKYVEKDYFPHLYDLAQFISADMQYVGWSAYWPVVSQYTVDGWDKALEKLINVKIPDGADEPFIPFMIAQWDFLLDPANVPQYRCVDVKGITYYHNAHDAAMGANANINHDGNIVDAEVSYQLDEIFNPWDLSQAANKETKRWVEFFTGNGVANAFYLDETPVVVDSFWEYCTFPERVLVDGTLMHRGFPQYIYEAEINIPRQYDLIQDPGGAVAIRFYSPPPAGSVIKVLYSTKEAIVPGGGLIQLGLTLDSSGSIPVPDFETMLSGTADAVRNNLPHDGSVELTVVQFGDAASLEVPPTVVTEANYESIASIIEAIVKDGGMTAMAAGLDLTWTAMINSPYASVSNTQIINLATDGNPNILLDPSPTADAYDDVTYIRNMAVNSAPYLDELDAEAIGDLLDVPWLQNSVVWPQPGNLAPPHEPGWVEQVADADAFADAIGQKFEIVIPSPKGRYEWAIVGRGSAAVDSAGASLVTAAFKNEDIDIGLAGLDMKDTVNGPRIPYVHSYFTGIGASREDYYDTLTMNDGEGRTALKDDYCTTWPVASSNMITVGGPAANLDSEYWNDFTDGIMTGPPFSDLYGYGVYFESSWDFHYQPGLPVGGNWGFGIVSTYKDLNGTVGFIVWGWNGEDTYFITKWLHEGGLIELQDLLPCATTIKVNIDYSQHPPRIIVPRTLGTISETPPNPDP